MKNEINIACNWNSIENSTEIFLFSSISNRNPFFLLEWFSCLYCSSRSHYTDEQSETHDKCWKINHKFDKLNKKNWTVHKLNPNKKKRSYVSTLPTLRNLYLFYGTIRILRVFFIETLLRGKRIWWRHVFFRKSLSCVLVRKTMSTIIILLNFLQSY